MISRKCSVLLLVLVLLMMATGCKSKDLASFPIRYAPPDSFVLGPEDVLIVTVWRNQDLSREMIVRPDGAITMPLVGDIAAAGVTAEELGKRIAERLTEYMSSPIVTVQVKEINSYHVYVLGEVKSPGKFQLKSFTTVLQSISLAGGFTQYANRNGMKVIRKAQSKESVSQQIEIPVSYSDMLSGSKQHGNFYLNSGDVIVVP